MCPNICIVALPIPSLCSVHLFLKQSLTPAQHKIIVACYTSKHRFFNETSPNSKVNLLCYSCSYNENESKFVLECPLYNSNGDKFFYLFDNVTLQILKSFFLLNHQVNPSLCLREASALCFRRN